MAGWDNLNGALTPLVGTAPTNYDFWGAADPNWADVSLLLRMDGSNGSTTFIDSSSNNYTISRSGNIQIKTNASVFGGSSCYSDGSSDYLALSNAALNFGTDDFTIEFYIKLETNSVSYPYIMSSSAYNSGGGFYITCQGPATGWGGIGTINFNGATGSNGAALSSGSVGVRDNNWHHIAFVRSGALHYCFVDGQLAGQTSAPSANYTGYGAAIFTSYYSAGGGLSIESSDKGWMDQLRITKGVARYTSNFTPSTVPAPGSSSDYNRITGLVGDGSTKYLNSNRANNADPQNNSHMGVYVSTTPTVGVMFIGAEGFSLTGTTALYSGGGRYKNSTSDSYSVGSIAQTYYGLSRASSTQYTVQATSSQTVARPSQTPESSNILLYRRGAPSTPSYSNARLSFYSIGESLDLALLGSRVTALVNEVAFYLNTGLNPADYDIDTLKYINAGYAAGGSLS